MFPRHCCVFFYVHCRFGFGVHLHPDQVKPWLWPSVLPLDAHVYCRRYTVSGPFFSMLSKSLYYSIATRRPFFVFYCCGAAGLLSGRCFQVCRLFSSRLVSVLWEKLLTADCWGLECTSGSGLIHWHW